MNNWQWEMISENFTGAWDEFVKEKYPNASKYLATIEPELITEFLIKYDLNLLNFRDLYDYFDTKKIVVTVDHYNFEHGKGFGYTIRYNFSDNPPSCNEAYDYNTLHEQRPETEKIAFVKAFEIRNEQLTKQENGL